MIWIPQMYVPLNVSRHEERVESEIALYGHGFFFFCKPRLNHQLHLCAVNPCLLGLTARVAAAVAAVAAAAARFYVSGKDAGGMAT